MSSPLKVGSALIREGTVVRDSVWMLKESFCPGWQVVLNLTADDLDRQIRDHGWSFIFLAGSLTGSSWGSWNNVALRSAAIRVLRKAELPKFNGFEITAIHKRAFLGFHYVTVIGHCRHAQQGIVLDKRAERIRQAALPGPNRTPPLAVPLPAPEVAK